MSGTLPSLLLLPQHAQPVLSTPVSATLRVLLLERVVPAHGGGYTVADTVFRARFLCMALLVAQFALWIVRWYRSMQEDNSDKGKLFTIASSADYLGSVSMTAHCIVAVMIAARQPASAIVAYHTAVVRLDEVLWAEGARTSDVMRFRRQLSFFFAPMMIHMLVMSGSWAGSYGWIEMLIRLGDIFCRIISDLSALNNAGRLIEVENRTAAFAQWLRQVVSSQSSPPQPQPQPQSTSQPLRYPPQWQTARECYVLLCEMCAHIDNIYAFQVVLCFVRGFIVMTVGVQEFVVTLTNPEKYRGSEGYFTEDTPSYIYMVPITLYILDACLVVFITVLQTQHAANLARLRRDILLHCETLAVQYIPRRHFNLLGSESSIDRPAPPDRIHICSHSDNTDNSAVDSSSQETPHIHYGWRGGAWSSLVDLCHRRPIEFTARGFFGMDYTLLATMFSAITTYTIILLNQSIQRPPSTDTPPAPA